MSRKRREEARALDKRCAAFGRVTRRIGDTTAAAGRIVHAIPRTEARMQDFRRLIVWQKSHELTLAVYHAFARVQERQYPRLRSQILRACAAVPMNIAEGCGHRSSRELARFAEVALASLSEVQYQLILARDLRLLHIKRYHELEASAVEVRRLLSAFAKAIRRQPAKPVS